MICDTPFTAWLNYMLVASPCYVIVVLKDQVLFNFLVLQTTNVNFFPTIRDLHLNNSQS